MAMEIFKLVGSIFVDNDAANQSISKTDEKAQGVGQTLLNGVKTAAEWGAAIAGAAIAAGAAIYDMGMDTAAAADEIDKGSIRMGISTDYYQQLRYAAGQCGVEMGTLEKAAKKLEGTDLTMDEALASIMSLETAEERATAASDLFGDSIAYTLSPLIEQSGESFDGLLNRANELGIVMGEDAVRAGVTLGDTMSDVKQSLEGAKNQLGSALLPILQTVADFLLQNMPTIRGMIAQLTPVVSQLATTLLPPMMSIVSSVLPLLSNLLAQILPPVTSIIEAVLPVIITLLEVLLPPCIQIVGEILPPLLSLLEPLISLLSPIIQLLTPILDLAIAILTPLIQLISSILQPLINKITSLISTALGPLGEKLSSVATTISEGFNTALTAVKEKVDSLKEKFSSIQAVAETFKEKFSAVWNAIKDAVSGAWEGIKGAATSGVNALIERINAILSSLNGIKIPSWVPVLGGKSFNISLLPYLEEGGILEKGQMGLLEGNGAEAVVPLDQNKKWINAVAEDMQNAVGGEQVTALLTDILEALENIAGAGVYINGEKLVGAIAPSMNQQLGRMAAREARA